MTTVVNIKDKFSKDLGMRVLARKIFEIQNGEEDMICDFEGVEFVSESFAQEYMQQKYNSNIKVSESNIYMILLQVYEGLKRVYVILYNLYLGFNFFIGAKIVFYSLTYIV